jgi:hypothetical protein
MALPQHTRMLAERLFQRYCGRLCDPAFDSQVRLDFELVDDAILLFELRPVFGMTTMMRRLPLARFRHRSARGDWTLQAADTHRPGWRRTPLARHRNLALLLMLVDEDAQGLFWGRVNGASLRWCSARGRCVGCERRYREALGQPSGDAQPAMKARTAATTSGSDNTLRCPRPRV